MLRKILAVFTLTLAALSLHAQAQNPVVEMRTSMGTIVLELYPENAPLTVKNFVQYVQEGFYNGTIFHRVIADFMIQGGGFTADMQQKKTRDPIKHEGGNGLKNQVGFIAMARTAEPHTATSQFFINVVDNQMLDFRGPGPQEVGYTVFGRVTKGLDVVNKIRNVPTGARAGHRDVPTQTVTIERVTMIEAKPAAK
ncbi:MAG: peptidyl-prolyl cis-trans isomerase [Betaproteobacteria bacterium]|nr:peptidyl-prolyl cis-trans isomerase [Betaproteobacteria bacterium]